MVGELASRLNTIHTRHKITPQEEIYLRQQKINSWEKLPKLHDAVKIETLRELSAIDGLPPNLLARSLIVSPDIVVVDEEIAQDQTKLQQEIKSDVTRLNSRGTMAKFFIGSDKKLIKSMEQKMEQNRLMIQ